MTLTNAQLELLMLVPKALGWWRPGRKALARAGYGAFSESLSPADLCEYLRQHPTERRAWEQYSEDKRGAGWYLLNENGIARVAYIQRPEWTTAFTDPAVACAEYIVRECESLYGGTLRWQHKPAAHPPAAS